ncbi:hypothetical protein AVEN_229420-1 [Araneus ventricosus]|uniref:Uncharacterized protein n=1 Tax=Araneus ventricosus TaxID=182803 RepID=A0A4Y2R6B0_ARAVE|nr:hypothetical protein AVEN_229420-1 [Araneus ventricosus]
MDRLLAPIRYKHRVNDRYPIAEVPSRRMDRLPAVSDTKSTDEASIQDTVSNVLNLNADGSDDEDDSECEKKSVSTSAVLKAIDDLRWLFTDSEAADENLSY